ncbi:MAG: Anaerobic nitric oxide reductase transcription regulator NorR [Candidatus Celerinatantimonas neptuna]|nr:MAG: Anaerobic nitric oxide reductase transcription regulator NorR [Candidatus Celerinatantimonas neptuna]
MHTTIPTLVENIHPTSHNYEPFHCYPLIGNSKEIEKLREKIKNVIVPNYPIIIYGEAGCEKSSIAFQIHHQDITRNGRFSIVSANISSARQYRENILYGIDAAQNGTLYLENIDTLDPDKQDQLTTLFSLFQIHRKLTKKQTRVILCTDKDTLDFTKKNQFVMQLLYQSPLHLTLRIPPLRHRREDIKSHILYNLKRLSAKIKIEPNALDSLINYSWPGNISELQNYLLRCVTEDPQHITLATLSHTGIPTEPSPPDPLQLADKILNQQLDSFEHCHTGLIKAIHYISTHFHTSITLEHLGKEACVSPSHLSYLFRKHLGISFKSLLSEIRILAAKQKLEEHPMAKITEIAYDVGFGDLSHFEKMFKRYLNISPREFRLKQRNHKSYLTSM